MVVVLDSRKGFVEGSMKTRNARAAWHHLYDTAKWKRLREGQLTAEPLCRFCLEVEEVTAADTVDHVKAHKGSVELFFEPSNLQSLCKSCHDTHKRRMELGKDVIRFSADGWPV